jgi:CubicO group peptidase (beta-lactamase class C family)
MALFGKFWDRVAPIPNGIRVDAERSARIDDYVGGQVRDGDPGLALAVTRSGAIVHAAGYGLADLRAKVANTPDTIFHLASCGKQFTALGLLMLAEERKLDLDDPVGKHLAGLAGFGPKVTIRQLLNHTSGIRDLYDEAGVEAVLSRCERPANADIIRTYTELGCPMAERGIKPGDAFAYSNSGYDLLGAVIERVSGQSYHDFFQRRVFDPAGMKDTFSVPDGRVNDPRVATGYARDDSGNLVDAGDSEYDDVVGSGSFYTTALDLCRYDQALASNALVSAASMQAALTSAQTSDGTPTAYGFGWYIGTYDGLRFADHEGAWTGYHTYIARCLDQPFSMFILANHPEANIVDLANVVTAVYR